MGERFICVYAARLASDISTDRTRLRFIQGHLSPGASCNPGAPDGTDGRPECRRTRNKAAASSSKGTIRRQPIVLKPAERKPQARLQIKLGACSLAERRFSNRLNVSVGCKASTKSPTRPKAALETGAPPDHQGGNRKAAGRSQNAERRDCASRMAKSDHA